MCLKCLRAPGSLNAGVNYSVVTKYWCSMLLEYTGGIYCWNILVEGIAGIYWCSILLEYTDSLWYPEIYRQLFHHPGDQATAKNLYADAVKV